MPRKRRARRIVSQPRPPRAHRDPMPALGDVIFLIQRKTYEEVGIGRLNAAMAAAVAVLAATARIGPQMCRHILLRDWLEGRVTVSTRTGRRTPILLPIALEVVERYIDERPENAGPWLFVTKNGNQPQLNEIQRVFGVLGRHCGFPGTRLVSRCMRFFDRSFDDEDDDRAAVAALSGFRNRAVDVELQREDVEEAARDPDRLRAVLEDNHELEGPAGRFLGKPGMELAAATRTFFISQDRVPAILSPAMHTDPVCKKLAGIAWPARGKKRLRNELRKLHFDHLDEMRRAGRIRLGEMAFLFSCAAGTVDGWIKRKRRAAMDPAARAAEARWIERAPALYLARPRGEKPAQFHRRLERQGCKLPFLALIVHLRQARVLGPRPRLAPAPA